MEGLRTRSRLRDLHFSVDESQGRYFHEGQQLEEFDIILDEKNETEHNAGSMRGKGCI